MRKLDTLCAVAAAIGGVLVAGIAQAPMKVVMGHDSVMDFRPMFVAKEKGFFNQRGTIVEAERIPVATNIPAALMSNSLQIGMATPFSLS